jgi:hypothetical protein
LQEQIDALLTIGVEGAVVPEGMKLVNVNLEYSWYKNAYEDEESRRYCKVYVLLPDAIASFGGLYIECDIETHKHSSNTEWRIYRPKGLLWAQYSNCHEGSGCSTNIIGDIEHVPTHEYGFYYPELGIGFDEAPFAMGLSPEEAVMSYKAGHELSEKATFQVDIEEDDDALGLAY